MTQPTDQVERPASQFETRLRTWLANTERRFEAQAAVGGDVLELEMLDMIGEDWWTGGGITAKRVQEKLNANPAVSTIRILMNSPGGDAFEGLAIQALLSRHPARVEVEVLGLCASAASVIAMAGDSIAMHEGALMMIHEPWCCQCGDAADMQSAAEYLTKVSASMIEVYARRTGRSREDIASMVAGETWMTAAEAVAEKFATSVVAAPKRATAAKASQALQVFMSARKPARAALPEPPAPPAPEPTPPAPVARSEKKAPTTGKGKTMEQQNMFASTVAIMLGLPAGSPESDITAAVNRMRDLEKEAVALTGVKSTAEALGAVRGLKEKADKYDTAMAELATVKAERDKQNFDTLLVQGQSERKITPALAKKYQEEFDAAAVDGRGEEVVARLRGHLPHMGVAIPSRDVRAPAPAGGSTVAIKWNDKEFRDLGPQERANLKAADPELYATMRREWEAAGSPLPTAQA